MMRNNKLFLLLIVMGLILIMPINNANSQLNIVGSTSIQPVCEELVEEYKKTHVDVDINIQGGGSGLGIKCSENCLADIGMSSKEVDNDKLNVYNVGTEGIVIVVNPNNPINDLSTNQIRDIFSGKITDWSEISNESGKINVISREEGSGTLDSFKNIIMKNSQIKKEAIILNSPGAIKQSVIQDENAIGFVSLVHADENLKMLSIDGVEISEKSICDGSYKLQRPFLFTTSKTPNNETLKFINWVLSDESQKIFKKEKIFRFD